MVMTLENVRLEVKNHRLMVLRPVDDSYETHENNELTEINIGEMQVKLNTVVSVNKTKYKIIKIIKKDHSGDYGEGYYLHSYLLNKSFNFIMAVLGEQTPFYRINGEFCNCFIGMEGEEEYGEYVYLLYRYNGTQDFLNFETRLQNHPMFVETINPDQYHTMYKFRIPERYKEDIYLITQGKYSYVSPKYKERIMHFHLDKNEVLEQILSRSEVRRKRMEIDYNCTIPLDVDLLSVPNVEDEIYLDKYRIPKQSNNFDLEK